MRSLGLSLRLCSETTRLYCFRKRRMGFDRKRGQLCLFRQLHLLPGVAATTGACYSYRKLVGICRVFRQPPLKTLRPALVTWS
jgi:hypothetical protein